MSENGWARFSPMQCRYLQRLVEEPGRVPQASAFPPAVSLRNQKNWVAPDQFCRGTCVACAAVALAEFFFLPRQIRLSAQYLYARVREQAKKDAEEPTAESGEEGLDIGIALQVLSTEGTCRYELAPYVRSQEDLDCAVFPDECRSDALVYRTPRPFQICPATGIEAVKGFLCGAANCRPMPVVIGVDVFDSFAEGSAKFDGAIVLPRHEAREIDGEIVFVTDEQLRGGHAMLVIGYRDDPAFDGGGYFEVLNSWGGLVGDGGFFKLPYAYVELFCTAAWTFKVSSDGGNTTPGLVQPGARPVSSPVQEAFFAGVGVNIVETDDTDYYFPGINLPWYDTFTPWQRRVKKVCLLFTENVNASGLLNRKLFAALRKEGCAGGVSDAVLAATNQVRVYELVNGCVTYRVFVAFLTSYEYGQRQKVLHANAANRAFKGVVDQYQRMPGRSCQCVFRVIGTEGAFDKAIMPLMEAKDFQVLCGGQEVPPSAAGSTVLRTDWKLDLPKPFGGVENSVWWSFLVHLLPVTKAERVERLDRALPRSAGIAWDGARVDELAAELGLPVPMVRQDIQLMREERGTIRYLRGKQAVERDAKVSPRRSARMWRRLLLYGIGYEMFIAIISGCAKVIAFCDYKSPQSCVSNIIFFALAGYVSGCLRKLFTGRIFS